MKLKKYIVLDSDDTPIPPKSMLCVCMITLGPWQSNLRYLNFLKKKMKKLNFWKKIKCKFFTPAPPPMINVGHNLESRTPADQHWLWGEGFSHFLSLSQILCTWLSEFWLKNWYFVKSVQSLLVLWWGSN